MATAEEYGVKTIPRAHLKGCIACSGRPEGSEAYLPDREVWFRNGRPRSDPAHHRSDRQPRLALGPRLDPDRGRAGHELRSRRWHPPPLVLATSVPPRPPRP